MCVCVCVCAVVVVVSVVAWGWMDGINGRRDTVSGWINGLYGSIGKGSSSIRRT